MTGYLTLRGEPEEDSYPLAIPNREIRHLVVKKVTEMFQKETRDSGLAKELKDAFFAGDSEKAEKLFGDFLATHISVRDWSVREDLKENYYHGYLLGLLTATPGGLVRSQREMGDGYSDISMQNMDTGVVIELKYGGDDKLDAHAENALKQIVETKYEEEFRRWDVERVYKYGVACYKRKCRILKQGNA